MKNEKTEVILLDQFCSIETCSICKNNLCGTKTNIYPFIDLRNSNNTKCVYKSYVVMGNLNLLGWVVLKSGVSLSEKLNTPLVKLCTITKTITLERLVNIDLQRRFFSLNFNDG